jgi:hypothetical protein
VLSDPPNPSSGFTAAQHFMGQHSLFSDASGVKIDKEFISPLKDNIRKTGNYG